MLFYRYGEIMKLKAQIMDGAQAERSIARIAHEIVEKNNGTDGVCLIGIHTRGIPMAKMLQEDIQKFYGRKLPLGYVDISLYRDDLSELTDTPEMKSSYIPVDLKDYTVILVDDVLYTGRTVRAAIDAVFSYGRPKRIQLAVLVDRGHRELPIRPDYVGKNIPTSHKETVAVRFEETDHETGVNLYTIG